MNEDAGRTHIHMQFEHGVLSAPPARQTGKLWQQQAASAVPSWTEKEQEGAPPEAIATGDPIPRWAGAAGLATGARKWTPVKRDILATVARHVENPPGPRAGRPAKWSLSKE